MSNPESLTLKVVQKSDPEQFGIESNHHEAEGEWRDIYVNFSGYFGKFGPHMFAAAPEMLEALKKLASIDFGSHGWDEFAESAAREARAAISKAEGTTP